MCLVAMMCASQYPQLRLASRILGRVSRKPGAIPSQPTLGNVICIMAKHCIDQYTVPSLEPIMRKRAYTLHSLCMPPSPWSQFLGAVYADVHRHIIAVP